MTKIGRRAAAWIGVAALAFAQLVIPAHACPMRQAEREAMTMPCDSTSAPSSLCHQHGNQGAQAVDQTSGGASLDALVPLFVATVPVARATPARPAVAQAAAFRATAPPLYLRHCALRF